MGRGVTAKWLNKSNVQICWRNICIQNMTFLIRMQYDGRQSLSRQINIDECQKMNFEYTDSVRYCLPFDTRSTLQSRIFNVKTSDIERIERGYIKTLAFQVAAMTSQGLRTFWSPKVVVMLKKEDNNVNLFGLAASLSF